MSYKLKFKLLTSALMSFLMASVMSGCIIAMKFDADGVVFLQAWRDAFLFAWPIAFPTAFFMSPAVQYLVKKVLPEG
jgi:hypothetical protein